MNGNRQLYHIEENIYPHFLGLPTAVLKVRNYYHTVVLAFGENKAGNVQLMTLPAKIPRKTV